MSNSTLEISSGLHRRNKCCHLQLPVNSHWWSHWWLYRWQLANN